MGVGVGVGGVRLHVAYSSCHSNNNDFEMTTTKNTVDI